MSYLHYFLFRYLLWFFRFNVINWNFPALTFNGFLLNQNKIFFISNIRFSLMRNKFLSQQYRVLSSAKLHISNFSIKKNISLMNILNSSGPNINLWGIPRKTFDQLLLADPMIFIVSFFYISPLHVCRRLPYIRKDDSDEGLRRL